MIYPLLLETLLSWYDLGFDCIDLYFQVRCIELSMVLVYILLVSCFFGWAALNRRRDITQPGDSSEPLLHPVEEDGINSETKENILGVKVYRCIG